MQTPKPGQTLRVGETECCPKGPSRRRCMDGLPKDTRATPKDFAHTLDTLVLSPWF
jgi:hypothetical protein